MCDGKGHPSTQLLVSDTATALGRCQPPNLDGNIRRWDCLRLAVCLDCPRGKPSPFTPVCAGGLPHEGPDPSLDSLCSGKFSISAAGAGMELSWLQPNLVARKHIKKSSGQGHCA